ncbi:MAG: hypothetical protein COB15_08380 [Flavobacteriales bacterium]|nr:MAG: hypothetical protein COB15_08380 [Flavobacteriales bacterium]
MADLTEQNIREIEVLVEARGVEMQELSYDLVDHICCMIEEKMESGKNYTSALEESIASFGKKGIRQIQEETTFLLTKNILAMRKTMHITGITAAILLLFGSIFKIQHWPGAGIIYVLGAAALCLLFMPLFLAVRIKEKPGKLSTISNIVGILGAITLCFGILFKIMHWPWASILMNIGGALLALIFLPLYVYHGAKTKQLKTSTIVPIIVAVAGFSLMFSLVRLQSSHNVSISRSNYHNNINQNIESTIILNNTISAELKNDSTINSKESINTLALKINSKSDELCANFIQSKLSEYSDEDIKQKEQTDFENFSITMGSLNSIQNQENGLPQFLKLIEEYKATYTTITGVEPNLLINNNFEYYLNKQNKMFAFRFVLRDINSLNLQVQQLHTSLLQYYKGKVS